MRICSKDPQHENFIVTAIETHAWLVNADGTYLDDKGCYESRIHDDTSWSCSECGAETKVVKTISELSELEAKEKLSQLRTLCEGLVKSHGNYNHLLRDEFVGKIQESISQLYGG